MNWTNSASKGRCIVLSYTKSLMAMAALVVAAGGAAPLPTAHPNVAPTAVLAQDLGWCDEGSERVDQERRPSGFEECQSDEWVDFSCQSTEVAEAVPGKPEIRCRPMGS
jgi:hypothetical protein